jgi:hypothetical protein
MVPDKMKAVGLKARGFDPKPSSMLRVRLGAINIPLALTVQSYIWDCSDTSVPFLAMLIDVLLIRRTNL